MHEEEEGDAGTDKILQRPLQIKRSKTINVSGLINHEQDSSVQDKEPKSSCQALRHAVSALTCIDDFHLEELGSGFFANIYKATHKVTDEEMVMKINKDMTNRPSALREIQLMNKLSHPNILRFLGVCVHEGQLHALTEYISGGTLENLLSDKDEELPWTLRIKLSLDIAKGIHYIHSCGVIHRDLSSHNILIRKGESRNYTAIIADFGLATRIPDKNETVPLNTVGSPWWMAPEVVMGKLYDERADLFSFGIMNMELTTRIDADPDRMPRTNSFGVDYLRICELVDYCPLDFLQLAFKCCQVQPDKRPSASFIVNTLEKIHKNLCENCLTNSGKFHKRSKSEDNIIQSMDNSLNMSGNENIFMTAEVIAQAMSQDDPHYSPASDNPFATISGMRDGRKVMDFQTRKVSVTSPSPTNSNLGGKSPFVFTFPYEEPQSQSLPSSPLMLRKAAEKLHQASLHGSEAIKIDQEQNMARSFCEEVDEIAEDPTSSADKRARFGNNRTRSLGSLDFFSFVGKHVSQRKNKHVMSTKSDLTGFCNRSTDILKESSFEDYINPDQYFSEEKEALNCKQSNYECVKSTSPDAKRSLGVNEDHAKSSATGLNSIQISKNERSTYTDNCFPNNNITNNLIPTDADMKRLPLAERKELNLNSDDKPVLAVQSGSFERDHFGKESKNIENKMDVS